ncbi:MAG TPA: beta-ketoacyl-ACP synthase 3, partial [Planctomycetota bacterium]|nr:beta-ketoacyl-ACP synthase 3 [Planctomycetota bacterium]
MPHHKHVSILGIGSALAEGVVTNDDLTKIVDTTDEWIFSRTGIKERRKLGPRQNNSDLATAAAQSALKDAGLTPADIGLIICATCSPDSILPSVACTVAGNLELSATPAFDLNAACSGFVYACSTAAQFIQSGAQKNVLVIGSEALSRMINYQDRSTCILFGDGAGAVVMGPSHGKREFLDFFLAANGRSRHLITAGVGSAHVPDEKYLTDKTH